MREFIYRFVAPNTIVRVWAQNDDGTYTNLLVDNTDPNNNYRYSCMEHEIEHGIAYVKYLNKRFVKVTDILSNTYPEAVNIAIDLDTDIL